MFSSILSIPGLIFDRFDIKAKIWPGFEAIVLVLNQVRKTVVSFNHLIASYIETHGHP